MMRIRAIFAAAVLCFGLVGCAQRGGYYDRAEDFAACYGFGCEWYGRANAIVSYARVVDIRGRNLTQDLELILDDGRIFAIYDYRDRESFKIGDRVQIEYRYRKVKSVDRIGSIYDDWRYYAD